jgi:cytochrome c oxidase subunit II
MTSERDRVHHGRPFGPALILALLCIGTHVPEGADSIRTIDVTLSRYAFSPQRIEIRVGERMRLNVVSADRVHGFQVKELGLNVRIPAGGRTVAVELTPKETGTFEITCSEYCGAGHNQMKGQLIVTPVS